MGQVLALDELLSARTIWRGKSTAQIASPEPTGHAVLDAALPLGGWPQHSISEILLPADGMGEIDLLLPTLARLTQASKVVALVAPPYIPYAPAWRSRGIELRHLHIIDAEPKQAVWAAEQCLRSGSCAAVLTWPTRIDQHALRRLQCAADTGQALGFVVRDRRHADNASPAPLRLEITIEHQVRVRKCRGGPPPPGAFSLPVFH
jgi:hypothetical protein